MSDLLTHEEYAAIAASLDFPHAAFIDGKYQKGHGANLTTTNPATGEACAKSLAAISMMLT